MKRFFYFLLFLGAVACENSDLPQEDSYSEENKTSTVQVVNETENKVPMDFPKELHEKNWKELSLPLKMEESDLINIEPNDSIALTQSEFLFLANNFISQREYHDWNLGKAKEIYQLKADKKYNEYIENLDLAQMKDAVAYPLGKINSDSALFLIWYLDYSSYEACPHYSGKELFVSKVSLQENKTWMISEEVTMGDPPMFAETHSSFVFNNEGIIHQSKTESSYEVDSLIETKQYLDTLHL